MKNLFTFSKKSISPEEKIASYVRNGRIPWSEGYEEYKYKLITENINSESSLSVFRSKKLTNGYGIGVDERSVEYPWIFSKISSDKKIMLDAGSTLNFNFIADHPVIKNKELTIYTFFPEKNCFYKNRINYVFGDLRNMFFKDETFEEIVSQSTIEHIDMDNSIYGYDEKHTEKKSFEYLVAVAEMIRVLKKGGKLMITFPYGKYENHGFFQQFDQEMLSKILDLFMGKGKTEVDYFKYEKEGWRFAEQSELSEVASYNPHTGKGKGNDGAAHCRSIACIEFVKN